MKFLKYGKYIVIAAGFLISAAFYVQSDTGKEILLREDAVKEEKITFSSDPKEAEREAKKSEAEEGREQKNGVNWLFESKEGGSEEGEEAGTDGLSELERYEVKELVREVLREELGDNIVIMAKEPYNMGTFADASEGMDKEEPRVKEESGEDGNVKGGNAGNGNVKEEKINLNTATKEELMELKGIGEAKADAIIAYREEFGGFGFIEEIMNISGIKEAAFEKIKDRICVS